MTLRLASRFFWGGWAAALGSAVLAVSWPGAIVGVIAGAFVVAVAGSYSYGYHQYEAELRQWVYGERDRLLHPGREAIKARSWRLGQPFSDN